MKNLFLIVVFAMISTLAFAQKEVKVEKEIENGKTITRVWVDGKEVKEGSAEYKKYAANDTEVDHKVWVKKRKKGKEEKVIIIKEKAKDDKGEVTESENNGDKKIMFIQVEEDIDIQTGEEVEVKVDVKADGKGTKKVVIKKIKDDQEEIEEIIINDNSTETIIDGDTKIIIKTEKDTNLDLEGIDQENIETINVIEKDGIHKIIIKTKDGKTVVKDISNGEKDVKIIKKHIRTEITENFDFDLDGLNPEDIETIDVKKTKTGKKVTIKTKDGKTIVKKIKEEKK